MSNYAICLIIFFIIFGGLQVVEAQQGRASLDLSGVLDSTVNYAAGAGDSQTHSFGIEEFANLRLRVRTGERATIYSAFNLIAYSGNYLENAAMMESVNQTSPFNSTPIIYGQNFAAGLELERLYFRINGDHIDTEAGLLRIPFGYSQVWGSSDFLNPRNPIAYNARPRGVLGANFSFYPVDTLKLMGFVAAPKNPLASDGGGFIPGLSLDKHWDKVSLQTLYAYETKGFNETPDTVGTDYHRFGMSLKADMEVGLVADALYTLNPDNADGIEGLSLGAGFDYSFLDGDLYVLFEYLFNGNSSATALGFGGNWSNHHYLYGNALYRLNDYCSLSFSTIFCFDDLSFTPIAGVTYELFQGFSLNLSVRVPLDQDTLSGGKPGELGPVPPGADGSPGERGARFIVNAGARLRF
ncbi:MAG: hypothetical protein LBH42_10565 [Treponema sp.]|nr:hypothetical protein [Treponema sp.]